MHDPWMSKKSLFSQGAGRPHVLPTRAGSPIYFFLHAHAQAATYPGHAWLRVPLCKKGAAACSALAFHRKKVFRRNPG